MVKKNYAAWHINPNDFKDNWTDIHKLKFFAGYAILAPSGHNTQPWHFESEQHSLLLRINPSRDLPYSGTLAAEPHISLGACLETLNLAARGFGYELDIRYELSRDLIAVISIKNKTASEPSLPRAITRRTSNRNPYTSEAIPPQNLQEFTQSDFANANAKPITDKDDISFLSDQTKHATHIIMSDPEFRLELSKWVRSNVSKQHDGMPGFVQGMPTPPSLIAKHIIKRIDISKPQAKKDADRVLHSPALVLLKVTESSPEAFLNVGRLYAQVCVRASQKGIASSGVAAAVIDADTKKSVIEHFKLEDQPVAIIRLGHTDKYARHTPRWPITAVFS